MPKPFAAASNQTAEKVLTVLEHLVAHGQPVKLGELAKELQMNTSTLYRFLVALDNTGYAVQHSDGRYGVTLKICRIADSAKKQFSITTLLHPYVIEASVLFRESAHLAQQEGEFLVYVDNVTETSQTLTIQQHIGKIAPLHCTGIGKLFLSTFSDEALMQYIAKTGLPRYTDHTCTTKEALLREFDFIRKNGYTFDNEECEAGVRCIAIPIYDYTGSIVAGLSITGPVSRITDELVAAHIQEFLKIGERACESLYLSK